MKLFALEADIEEKPSEMLIDKLTKEALPALANY